MLKFILSDTISFLSAILIVGGIVLFVLVLKEILKGDKPSREKRLLNNGKLQQPDIETHNETDTSLIEAHLNALAKEIAAIKQIVSDKSTIEDMQKQIDSLLTRKDTGGATDHLQKEILKINAKLEAIYNVMSDLAKG